MNGKEDSWGDAVGDAGWAALVPPAPGDLRIVQALVITSHPEKGTDQLAGPLASSYWLARWGLLPPATEVSENDHRRLIGARDGLRALARCNNGLPWDENAVARLQRIRHDRRQELIVAWASSTRRATRISSVPSSAPSPAR